MAIGYVLARRQAHTLVVHDTDIVTYERQLLVRLCAPLVREELGYAFAKSYYARVSNRLYGRVVRLLLWPMIGALIEVTEGHALPAFLNSFRYPLSGEFALTAELAGALRLPGDWGLETGLLCEVHRLCGREGICQVDVGFHHDHKHRPLGGGDVEDSDGGEATGLAGMAGEIVRTLLWNLDTRGVAVTPAFVEALGARYAALGREHIRRHHHDAVMNGLAHSVEAESRTVALFASVIAGACDRYSGAREGPPNLPSWEEIAGEMPGFLARLAEAVEADCEPAAARP
jgi:glucosyl-3-phosphoglycerate synthase